MVAQDIFATSRSDGIEKKHAVAGVPFSQSPVSNAELSYGEAVQKSDPATVIQPSA